MAKYTSKTPHLFSWNLLEVLPAGAKLYAILSSNEIDSHCHIAAKLWLIFVPRLSQSLNFSGQNCPEFWSHLPVRARLSKHKTDIN